MNKNPKVTVLVCVYNEEANVKNLIDSVLKQKEEGFELEQILICNDASSDKTVEIIKGINSPKINLIDSSERKGKSQLLNSAYKMIDSDIIIQTDGDIIFVNPFLIRDIIQPMLTDENVYMCGGNHMPTPGTTFTEKAINYTFDAYLPLRTEVRGGNNVFSVAGCILALKKDLFKKLTIPQDMIVDDVFTYYSCLNMGYKYKYVESALVNFRQPQILKDQIKQNIRFVAGHMRMYKYFPIELVDSESFIPAMLLRKYMFQQFLKHPIHSVYIYLVNLFCKYRAKRVESVLTAKWDAIGSTKVLHR